MKRYLLQCGLLILNLTRREVEKELDEVIGRKYRPFLLRHMVTEKAVIVYPYTMQVDYGFRKSVYSSKEMMKKEILRYLSRRN